MAWKAPKIVEVPVGMEINMYACAARKKTASRRSARLHKQSVCFEPWQASAGPDARTAESILTGYPLRGPRLSHRILSANIVRGPRIWYARVQTSLASKK